MGFVHVAVGVIRDDSGRLLLAKRRDEAHQGGLWEFPGGKVEPGETVEAALGRELEEELLIRVQQSEPLIQIRHHYGDKSVLLDVREVTRFRGAPEGNEGQPLAWVPLSELVSGSRGPYPLPVANDAILKALRLPDSMLISGGFQSPRDFLSRLEKALQKGIRLFLFRPSDSMEVLSSTERERLLDESFALCSRFQARLIVHESLGPSQAGHGTHLPAATLMVLHSRPVGGDRLCGASCHREEELLRAAELDLDYVLLSPVTATESHPEQPSMGWEKFARLVEKINVPVFALGGLGPGDIRRAHVAGAQGIAAIRSFWGES